MVVGLIGVGIVGGTLKTWFSENTNHEVRCYDPNKGMKDSLENCDAIFVSVPVPASEYGQDLSVLKEAISYAKKHTDIVFIRSTVLPGTSDSLGCIAMPEFLTERFADKDMNELDIVTGPVDYKLLSKLFPNKRLIMVSNKDAELSKFTHNCFGAMKVTYFNIIHYISEALGAKYELVKEAAGITGFIEKEHTQVPGPDGLYGYGGKCFPENIDAIIGFCKANGLTNEHNFFAAIKELNNVYRKKTDSFFKEVKFA